MIERAFFSVFREMQWRSIIFLIFIFGLLSPYFSFSQSIENVKASYNGDKVIITYDLLDKNPCDRYNVSLYTLVGTNEKPIKSMLGDFGPNVIPDSAKRISWDAKSDLGIYFDGNINIKVIAEKIESEKISHIQIIRPANKNKYVYKRTRKGTPLEVNWLGGSACDSIRIVLFNEKTARDIPIHKVVNNNHDIIYIVKKETVNNVNYRIPAGRHYKLKIVGSNLGLSETFQIRPGTPFIVKVLPFLGLGAAAYIYMESGNTTSPGQNVNPEDQLLPGPVKP